MILLSHLHRGVHCLLPGLVPQELGYQLDSEERSQGLQKTWADASCFLRQPGWASRRRSSSHRSSCLSIPQALRQHIDPWIDSIVTFVLQIMNMRGLRFAKTVEYIGKRFKPFVCKPFVTQLVRRSDGFQVPHY